MSSQGSPGKTAPRLLHDLLRYDPARTFPNSNVLADPPPIYEEGQPRPPQVPAGSCQHEYVTKLSQSVLPPQDERPGHSSIYKVAAVCKRCRAHVMVVVDYRGNGWNPCPNADFPLHHFRNIPSNTSLHFTFECSAHPCPAMVSVIYEAPQISAADVKLLTEEAALQRRYEEAVQTHPEREGWRLATPVDTLFRLRRYIGDALNPDHNKRRFPANNKRFMEAFGEDCRDLLNRLGFKYADDSWTLPQPDLSPDPFRPDPERKMLENYTLELQCLIDKQCAAYGYGQPDQNYSWRHSREDFERILAMQGYDHASLQRRSFSHPPDDRDYAALGAMGDFSDRLVEFAYERQTKCDPGNAPYYFDCLKAIQVDRQGGQLDTKVAILESQNVIGRKDIREAYRFLDINPDHSSILSDAMIMGKYEARRSDTSTSQQQYLRDMLKRLGHARNSQTLVDAASESLETYSQAIAWLDAEDSTSDDWIPTLAAAKNSENPSNEEKTRKAVQIIAAHRNSESLRNWDLTGEAKSSAMDLDTACSHLNFTFDPNVDQGSLEALFVMARNDVPGPKTEEAIQVVTNALQSRRAVGQPPSIWPVGLESHGNTCYLNSLLQYFFSIKPFRDLILNFDKQKFDLQAHENKTERVFGLGTRRAEIEIYQKLADDLRNLFESMIKAPGRTVKPEADLVCRTFLRASDILKAEAKAADPNANSNMDTSTAAPSETLPATEMDVDKPADADNDSMAPLVDSQDAEAKKDEIPLNGDADFAAEEGVVINGLPPPSPPASVKDEQMDVENAPPLPPRTNPSAPQEEEDEIKKAEKEARAQQDVSEVMENILKRLRYAIKPRGTGGQGEQLDMITDLFWMENNLTTLTEGAEPKTEVEYWHNILFDPVREPTSIYDKLDETFDLQRVERGERIVKQYRTLKNLPPVLQINIPRSSGATAESTGTFVGKKNTDPVHLEEVLYLDRYCDVDDPEIIQRREQWWEWRRELRSLQAEREVLANTNLGVDGPAAVEATNQFLAGLWGVSTDLNSADLDGIGDLEDELSVTLSQEAEKQRSRLTAVELEMQKLKAKISQQFQGFENMKYQLHAVFFHRGGAGSGHYFIYIRDFKNGLWRVYNDEKVEEFTDMRRILDAGGPANWQDGTPTYAVYVKDGQENELVEAVCREPEAQEISDDVQMQDASEDTVLPKFLESHGGTEGPQGNWPSSGASYESGVKW